MKFAKIISYITHPIFMTTYMVAFTLFQKNSYLYYSITPKGRWFFLFITLVLTVLAPLLSIGYLYYTKFITSIHIENRKERYFPMAIMIMYTYGLYYMFSQFNLPPVLIGVISAALVGVSITLLITFFWKISAHMIGISGLGGVLLALSQQLHPIQPEVFILLFLAMGITGYARLKMNSHTLAQVFAGWVIGLPLAYFSVIYFSGV